MTKKNVKIAVFLLIAIASITAYSFHIGYKIPQKDNHKDWPEFPNHTSKELVIKKDKKSILNFTTIPKSDLLLIYYKNPDSTNNTYGVMSKTGKLIHDFGYCIEVYIDEIHNRLLAAKFINNDSTTFIAFDAKTFKRIPVKYANIKIEQNFDAYLMQEHGVEKIDSTGYKQTKIKFKTGETEELFKEKYRKNNSKLAVFLKELKEVFPFDDENQNGYRNASYVKTDKNGVIYRFSYDDSEKESIKMLCTSFFDDLFRDDKKQPSKDDHISKADSSIVVANEFDANFGLYNHGTAGSGGGSGPLFNPECKQIYIDYYKLKLNKLSTYFKHDNRKTFVNNYGIKLNEPKSDDDTLAFLSQSNFYLLYKSTKKR